MCQMHNKLYGTSTGYVTQLSNVVGYRRGDNVVQVKTFVSSSTMTMELLMVE